METVAFYRETVIKTYGFNERLGLTWLQTEIPFDSWGLRTAAWLDRICRGERGVLLLMVRPLSKSKMAFSLLWEEKSAGGPESALGETPNLSWRVEKEVELLYFQGPHYGDRYGIASAALEAVLGEGIPLLAAACLGATVFLVLPKGMSPTARSALGRSFTVPEYPGRKT